MTVNPGFGGQKFIMESYNKITELREMIDRGGYRVLIEVDGGIDTSNASKLIQSGVNVLVAGNSVFSCPSTRLYTKAKNPDLKVIPHFRISKMFNSNRNYSPASETDALANLSISSLLSG